MPLDGQGRPRADEVDNPCAGQCHEIGTDTSDASRRLRCLAGVPLVSVSMLTRHPVTTRSSLLCCGDRRRSPHSHQPLWI